MSAAEQIARALSGAYRSGTWWRSRCPVHGSRGGTLALRDGDRGLVVHCHAGCDRQDILAELRRRGLLNYDGGIASACRPDPDEAERRRAAEVADRRRRIAIAMDIWGKSHPPAAAETLGLSVKTLRRCRWVGRGPGTAKDWGCRPLC